MSAKHTPGPWRVEYGESLSIRSADDSRLATMNWLRGRHGLAGRLSDEEVAANALVFAAAPDLLEALKRLLGATDAGNAETHDLGCRCVIHEARAAISRASR
jgi:hypothetical protein